MDADPSTMDLDLSLDEEIAGGWEDFLQGQTQSIELQQGDYGTVNSYLSVQGDLDHGCGPHHHPQTCSCIEQNRRNQVSPAATALDSFYVVPNLSPFHAMLHNPQCLPPPDISPTGTLTVNTLTLPGNFMPSEVTVEPMFSSSYPLDLSLPLAPEPTGPSWASTAGNTLSDSGLVQYSGQHLPQSHSQRLSSSAALHVSTLPPKHRAIKPKPVLALPSSTTVTRGQDDTRILRPEPPSRLRVDGEVERSLTRKRRRSPSPTTKRAKVRMEYYVNCFQGDLRPLRCPDPGPKTRTRSARVCFRCQDQKLKCEGGFPCKKCCDVTRRGRVKHELPCIEADLHALNPFFDLLIHRWADMKSVSEVNKFMQAQPWGPHLESQEDIECYNIRIRGHYKRPRRSVFDRPAGEWHSHKKPKPITATRWAISRFSRFSSTGTPGFLKNLSSTSAGPPMYGVVSKPVINLGRIKSPAYGAEIGISSTLLGAIFLGEIAGRYVSIPPHDIYVLRFYSVAKCLGFSADILKQWKACPVDIKPHRKIGLGLVLIALLIGAEHRGTYILDSLRLKFEQKSFDPLETIGEHLTRIVGFICRGMTTMNHLRLCMRHFLRKLFGNGQLPQEFWELVVAIFGHFDDQLDPATFTPGHRDLDETRIRQQLFQRLQKYLRDSFPNSPPKNFGITKEEFNRRVAYLGCEDLPKDTGPVGARRMKECLVGTKGTSPRYLDDHGLREFVQGLEKSGYSTLKRAASDPYQISGDSTYDTAFKYLFLKWMEG